MRQLRERAIRGERGSVLLSALFFLLIMSLLGVALFDLATVEVSQAKGTREDLQAFYCAEASLARVYKDPARQGEITAAVGTTITFSPDDLFADGKLVTKAGDCVPTVVYNDTDQSLTSTATLNRTQRTVQIRLGFLAPSYKYVVAAAQGPVVFRGTGDSCSGTPCKGGRDKVSGDVFFGTNTVHLWNQAMVVPYSASAADGPTVSQPTPSMDYNNPNHGPDSYFPCTPTPTLMSLGCPSQADAAPSGTPTADGQHPASEYVSTTVSGIKTAAGSNMMASYNGTTIYNLNAIWHNLPTSGGALAAPPGWNKANCGTYAFNTRERVYCDLRFMNIMASTSSPPSGPDGTSYYFRGLANSACPGALACDLVAASAELQQLGYTVGHSSVDVWNPTARLIVAQASPDRPIHNINNPDPNGCAGQCPNLVDLTIFDWSQPITCPSGADGCYAVKPPPILLADAYVRFDDSTASVGLNGRATMIVSQPDDGGGGSVVFSDNVYYLNGPTTTRTNLSGCERTDSTCGLADMLGLVAEKHIWYGDPGASGASFYDADGVLLAGQDLNYYFYNSTEGSLNLKPPSGTLTVHGTMLSNGQLKMFHDWAQTGTFGGTNHYLPVRWDPNGTCAGKVDGCWVFQKLNTTTGEVSDCTTSDFAGCIPFANENSHACGATLSDSCQVDHFQLKAIYDTRLRTNPEVIPPGLPSASSGRILTGTFTAWKDCGPRPDCP